MKWENIITGRSRFIRTLLIQKGFVRSLFKIPFQSLTQYIIHTLSCNSKFGQLDEAGPNPSVFQRGNQAWFEWDGLNENNFALCGLHCVDLLFLTLGYTWGRVDNTSESTTTALQARVPVWPHLARVCLLLHGLWHIWANLPRTWLRQTTLWERLEVSGHYLEQEKASEDSKFWLGAGGLAVEPGIQNYGQGA